MRTDTEREIAEHNETWKTLKLTTDISALLDFLPQATLIQEHDGATLADAARVRMEELVRERLVVAVNASDVQGLKDLVPLLDRATKYSKEVRENLHPQAKDMLKKLASAAVVTDKIRAAVEAVSVGGVYQ